MPTKLELTRERLLVAALELFAEQVYDETSVAQIAARAGVAQMTFFRHFPTKESLLVDDPYDPVIGDAVARESPDLDPLTRAARGVRAAWRGLPEPAGDEVRTRLRIVARTPTLRASMAGGSAATESVIADALTATDTPRRDAVIAAAAVVAALNTALLEWSTAEDGTLGSAIDSALDVLERRHD